MKARLRILHLEDNPLDAELIHSAFKAEALSCDIVQVKSREQFEQALVHDAFDVILSDYSLPHYNGIAALEFARQKAPDVPFILLSGTLGEDLAVESLRTGATDYILKQRLNRLVPAVQRAVREAEDHAQKRLSEEALEGMRRRNELLLESTSEGICGLDVDGRTTFVNRAGASMLGYEAAELIGQPGHEILHPARPGESACHIADCPIQAAVQRGVPQHRQDEVFWRKNGTSFPAEYVCNPIWGEEAKFTGTVITFRDITERKRVEDQLRQAQKMEAIGQLAGGIAHDFNNILGCIVGFTELATLDISDKEAVQDNLDEVLKASHRAKDLVLQILTFSRQQQHERKPIQLQPVLKEALKFLRASLPSTITIRTDIGGDVAPVLADATQMYQIIMNLATNAAHAMSGRGQLGVTLAIRTVDADFVRAHPDLKQGQYVALSVSDSGCGMSHATLQRIFEPFFTTKPAGEGTGLGLAVVHGIMKSHEGTISVESEPGKGTTFHLYFLAHQDAAIEPMLTSSAIPRGNGERILFVDDEVPLAMLGRKMLERAGYKVTSRTSPVEALAIVRADINQFDLVVSDLTMPTMTGSDLAIELLKLRPNLPIILATGFSGEMTLAKAKSLGIRELLTKPIAAQSLAESVKRTLA